MRLMLQGLTQSTIQGAYNTSSSIIIHNVEVLPCAAGHGSNTMVKELTSPCYMVRLGRGILVQNTRLAKHNNK